MADNGDFESGYTREKLKTLEDMQSDGVLEITYQGRRIVYRSVDELEKIIQKMRRALGVTTKKGKRGLFGGTRVVARHSKGLDD